MAAVALTTPRAEAIRKISPGDRIDTGISGSPMQARSRIIPPPGARFINGSHASRETDPTISWPLGLDRDHNHS